MEDSVFGTLHEAGEGWQGNCLLDFGGVPHQVELLIQGEAPSGSQREAFARFLEDWPVFQGTLVRALIRYYNEEERWSYGPDGKEEGASWWPEIETEAALLEAVTLETLAVPEDFLLEEGPRVYLLFSRAWGGGDPDGNGLGVCWLEGAVGEIGYKDIAF